MKNRPGPRIDLKAWELIAYFIAKELAKGESAVEDGDIPDTSGWAQLSSKERQRAAQLVAQQSRRPLTNKARKQIALATGKAERTVSNVLKALRDVFAPDASLSPERREALLSGITRHIAEESIKD